MTTSDNPYQIERLGLGETPEGERAQLLQTRRALWLARDGTVGALIASTVIALGGVAGAATDSRSLAVLLIGFSALALIGCLIFSLVGHFKLLKIPAESQSLPLIKAGVVTLCVAIVLVIAMVATRFEIAKFLGAESDVYGRYFERRLPGVILMGMGFGAASLICGGLRQFNEWMGRRDLVQSAQTTSALMGAAAVAHVVLFFWLIGIIANVEFVRYLLSMRVTQFGLLAMTLLMLLLLIKYVRLVSDTAGALSSGPLALTVGQ